MIVTRANYLLHVLAQRSPPFSPARTCDQDCLSPFLMRLDVGEVDSTSHIHVPAVSVQSNAPFADLSCTGHAAAVSSQGSSTVEKNDCTGGQMCHGSLAPLTWCGLPPGLDGSRLVDTSQMKWPSAGTGTEARHAQNPMKIVEHCPSCSISRPSSRRQAQNLVSDANGGVLFAGKEEDSDTSDENVPLPKVVSGRRHHRVA